ncbi:MAG: cytochrome C [Campylobacterales bacterium]|nr:cytochrome C [Campylobacterales bacterium]
MTGVVSEAAVYKGEREFHKQCKVCHDDGQDIASTFKRRTWKKMMQNSGEGLAELHLNNEKAKKSWKYFKSKKFQKNSKHLKDFMVEYAKESGNVPACN